MVNASLLEGTISHIRDFPELHSQSFYYERNEFGLAACFAGRALILAGYTPIATMGTALRPYDKAVVGVWPEAREVLGINERWASNLFSPRNNRRMLELKVKDILNGSPLDRYHELLSDWAKCHA